MKNKRYANHFKLNNSNDLLRIILEIKGDDNNLCFTDIYAVTGIDFKNDVDKYAVELEEKGCIKIFPLNDIHCFPHAKKLYSSPIKRISEKILPVFTHAIALCFGLLIDEYFIPLFKCFCNFIKDILK